MPAREADSSSPSPLLLEFGRRLRALRESSGVSQERLAHICGVDRTYVGALERGRKNPSFVILVRLAAGLGIDPADLVQGFRPRPSGRR